MLYFKKGGRRIDKALTAAVQQMSQSRPLSAKIAVVIVTGPQSQAADTTQLRVAAQPLRDLNAHIFVFGIGKNVRLRELNLITKDPQDVQTILSPSEIILNVHRWSRQLRINANEGEKSFNLAEQISLLLWSTDFFASVAIFLYPIVGVEGHHYRLTSLFYGIGK